MQFLKRVSAIILIVLITIQTFSKLMVLAEFSIYRNYIKKNICENRYRPQLHCNGNCVLMKKMAAEDKRDTPSGTTKLNWETTLYLLSDDDLTGNYFPLSATRVIPPHNFLMDDSFIPDVFRPPLA